MVLPSSMHVSQSGLGVLSIQSDEKGEGKESLEGRHGSIMYMTFIYNVLCGQNSVTQCHLIQRRLGAVVQLCAQEEEEMALVSILPVSATVIYGIGSKSCPFASIISLNVFYSSLCPISPPLFSILS